MLRTRVRAGAVAGLVMSLVFAAVMTLVHSVTESFTNLSRESFCASSDASIVSGSRIIPTSQGSAALKRITSTENVRKIAGESLLRVLAQAKA